MPFNNGRHLMDPLYSFKDIGLYAQLFTRGSYTVFV
jgi:hypothetical protein